MRKILPEHEYYWIGRTRNYMGERIYSPFEYFSKTQYGCICRAVNNRPETSEKIEYEDAIETREAVFKELGVQNINDLDSLQTYTAVPSCNESCGNCSKLVLRLVYKRKFLHVFRCGAFGTLFYFWE